MSAQSHTKIPPYFGRIIAAHNAGVIGRNVHLGHWDEPPREPLKPDEFELAQRYLTSKMIEMSQLENGRSALDVGCGLGGLIQQIDAQFSDAALTGINIDVCQLEACQQLQSVNGNALRWQEADACDLPFSDQSFNFVFCIEAMFHFASRKKFLAEAWRVLKPGGRIVLTDFRLIEETSWPLFCVEAMLNDGYGPWPDPFCRDGSACEILTDGNWVDVECIDATLNTLPGYSHILPSNFDERRVPDDAATRAAMTLWWLHRHDGLKYEYIAARRGRG